MARQTENSITINAPLDLVWDVTNDVAGWHELYSEYAESVVLEEEPGRIRFRLTTHPDENGKQWSWVSERVADRDRGVVHARRVETGPFEYMNIHWYYSPGPDGVDMRWVQEFEMRAAAPIDDDGMAARINTNTKIQMERIRDRLEVLADAVQ